MNLLEVPANALPRTRTLLLVDDEASILSSLKRLFRPDGYRILTATSGTEGLALLAEQAVDVILSDQRMPGMTGIDFLREARRLHPHTVRITLSGYTDLQSIIEAVNEGAVYKFLTKPWDDDRLRDHVAQAFEQSELVAENRRLCEAIRRSNLDLAIANQQLERMVRDECELRQVMQNAAGASRDALDALPMAVFGIGDDGMLAYVNRLAVCQWPHWSSALGCDPVPSMRQVLAVLESTEKRDGNEGFRTTIDGHDAWVWIRPMTGQRQPLGQLVLVQLQPEAVSAGTESLV